MNMTDFTNSIKHLESFKEFGSFFGKYHTEIFDDNNLHASSKCLASEVSTSSKTILSASELISRLDEICLTCGDRIFLTRDRHQYIFSLFDLAEELEARTAALKLRAELTGEDTFEQAEKKYELTEKLHLIAANEVANAKAWLKENTFSTLTTKLVKERKSIAAAAFKDHRTEAEAFLEARMLTHKSALEGMIAKHSTSGAKTALEASIKSSHTAIFDLDGFKRAMSYITTEDASNFFARLLGLYLNENSATFADMRITQVPLLWQIYFSWEIAFPYVEASKDSISKLQGDYITFEEKVDQGVLNSLASLANTFALGESNTPLADAQKALTNL